MKQEPENPRVATKGEVTNAGKDSFPRKPEPVPHTSRDSYLVSERSRNPEPRPGCSYFVSPQFSKKFGQYKIIPRCREERSSHGVRRKLVFDEEYDQKETYTKLELLGKGAYGTVFKGRSNLTNCIVAMKEIRMERDQGVPYTAIRELSLLKQLSHINIITLHDTVKSDNCMTLILEYMDKDLRKYMVECGNMLRMRNVKLFFYQLLRGLSYCHKKEILHRDLKAQNLLINKNGLLKIADFGLACAQTIPSKRYTSDVVSLGYRSPDVLIGTKIYSTELDMWSTGCVFYEMASGHKLFPGSNFKEQLQLITQLLEPLGTQMEQIAGGDGNISHLPGVTEALIVKAPRLHNNGISLMASFLLYECTQKFSAAEAMKHPYFNSLGAEVHELDDRTSIYSIQGINFIPDVRRFSEKLSAQGNGTLAEIITILHRY